MEKQNKILNINKKSSIVGIIHILLLQSYAIYFFAVILGVIFDNVIAINIFPNHVLLNQYLGIIMILIGSIFIYWAQSTTSSSKVNNTKDRDLNFFLRGPYKYTRNPTNFGLAIMSLGLGFLINSFFSIIFIIIAYLISRIIFIKKQDSILEERYGEVFRDYKQKVKDWI